MADPMLIAAQSIDRNLGRIADALEALMALSLMEPDAVADCPHPDDERFAKGDQTVCGLCKQVVS